MSAISNAVNAQADARAITLQNEAVESRKSAPVTALPPQQWERKPLIGYEESRPFEFGKRGIGRLAQPESVLTAWKDTHYALLAQLARASAL